MREALRAQPGPERGRGADPSEGDAGDPAHQSETCGCARRGMKRGHCNGRCRTMRSGSSCAVSWGRDFMRWPKMWRIRRPDGSTSDMVNLSRAKDAAAIIAERGPPERYRRLFHWKIPSRTGAERRPSHCWKCGGGWDTNENGESTPCTWICTGRNAAGRGRGAGSRANRQQWRTVGAECTVVPHQEHRGATAMHSSTVAIQVRPSRAAVNWRHCFPAPRCPSCASTAARACD
jgi:hypothetical protein